MGELYLLTGAASHLGTALVKLLKEKHKKIRALVLPEEKHLSQLSGEDIAVSYTHLLCVKIQNDYFGGDKQENLCYTDHKQRVFILRVW